jgi:hypothetical protein
METRRFPWHQASSHAPLICSVMTLIVDVATGAPTDSGFSNEYPDLAGAGRVVTDYRAP